MSAESLGVAGVRPCAGNRGATCTCPALRCLMEDPAHLPHCSASEVCSCLTDDPWRFFVLLAEVYFLVKRWRPVYRRFNLIFCNMRRPLSLVICEEEDFNLKGIEKPMKQIFFSH